MIYLASPYSDPDPGLRNFRYHAACATIAYLLREGRFAFSPIVHSHPLTEYGLPGQWEFWETYDRWHLAHCRELWVLQLQGWERSLGVQREIEIARHFGKPIRLLRPPPPLLLMGQTAIQNPTGEGGQ